MKGNSTKRISQHNNMKKNFFRAVALSALLAMGVNGAQAQSRTYDCPPLNPEYQALAEQVVSLNMEDPDKANKVYMSLSKKIKKSKEDLVAVGTYFLEHDNYPAASMCAKDVYTLDPTYVPGLMFYGEVYMKAQRWGEAGGRFDEVLAIDPTNIAAMKRNAFVYKNVNPHAAIDYLNKIKEADPSFTDADKEKGDIYYKLSDYAKAIECYNSYYAATPKEEGKIDIAACENYLQSLFSMSVKDETYLDKIIAITQEIQPLAPKDIIIPRMAFFAKYNKVETSMDYDGALKAADDAAAYIRDKQFADSVYMYLDYDFAAKLAKEQGNLADAINYYELAVNDLEAKAADLDDEKKKAENATKRGSYYYEISNLYVRNKQAAKGIEVFNKYLELLGDKADLSDKYQLGYKYAAAYQQKDNTPEQKKEYHDKAISTFKAITEAQSENRMPILMSYRMLANLSITDANKPSATACEYYTKLMNESEGEDVKEKAKNLRFEACRYLFFYYVSIDTPSKAEATKYATIAKEINPDNDFVKAAFEHLKTM